MGFLGPQKRREPGQSNMRRLGSPRFGIIGRSNRLHCVARIIHRLKISDSVSKAHANTLSKLRLGAGGHRMGYA